MLCMAAAPGVAAPLPGDAGVLLPRLAAEIDRYWPALTPRAFAAGLIEQESGWRVMATMHTAREEGAGLGQFTRAYRADGSLRFDALAEARRLDPSLAAWSWRDPYHAGYQLRAVVLKLREHGRDCAVLMANGRETLACAAARYNGGAASVAARIRLCRLAPACQPGRWFGHLERQVVQSALRQPGYGASFADINSRYPARVFVRMRKYEGRL
jgi:hypothetical protein